MTCDEYPAELLMITGAKDAVRRSQDYCTRKRIAREEWLGWGQDGVVFSTNRRSAVKAFRYREQYETESSVYRRLSEHDMVKAAGFSIPRLFDNHDELMVIEIEVVNPPYAIDFASAYLDEPPDFPPEVMEPEQQKRYEEFGEDWPQVAALIEEFRRIGIHLSDVNPRNISLR